MMSEWKRDTSSVTYCYILNANFAYHDSYTIKRKYILCFYWWGSVSAPIQIPGVSRFLIVFFFFPVMFPSSSGCIYLHVLVCFPEAMELLEY